ncbi:uncharacterized protein PAE49_017671 [Odontesthes bonariensis]|uniref:uncharacterized protein LOC142401396 n=1 Tax=Odontesthes bonariensis TaxID=219752 RepID=UPI003F58FB70
MKVKYLAEKRHSGKSGAKGKINYEYFEEIDLILGSRPVVTAAKEATVDSGTVTPVSSNEDPGPSNAVLEDDDDDDDDATMETDSEMDIPDTPASVTPVTPAGSLFRRPLKRKVTPAQQLNDKLSEMMERHERQEERDRDMLKSIVSSVNRLVDCIEKQTTSASFQPPFPYPHTQPGPNSYQSFLYMQNQHQPQPQPQPQQQSYANSILNGNIYTEL